MIEIKIPAVSYKDFEIIEDGNDLLTLHDDYIQVRGSGLVKKMDETLGMAVTRQYDYLVTIFKNKITSIEAGYSVHKEVYEININTPSLLTIIAPDKRFCFDLAKQLIDWKIS